MSKRRAAYAAPEDKDDFSKGAYLIVLDNSLAKDTPFNRERAFEELLDKLDEGNPPFDSRFCFSNGLSEEDLIFISKKKDVTMNKNNQDNQVTEQEDIIVAANEVIELAALKVELAKAYRSAQQYKDLVSKIVALDGGHLSEEECKIASEKVFIKTIKALAEARVKVDKWYQTSSGLHELILNELTFATEEITKAIAQTNGKSEITPDEEVQTQQLDDVEVETKEVKHKTTATKTKGE
ncbi:MAG: hypothetical protein F6K58_25490 [Symploca sp. SIO2E9]|nr:hypothetical protein [Symploca sp. SIO2E9]